MRNLIPAKSDVEQLIENLRDEIRALRAEMYPQSFARDLVKFMANPTIAGDRSRVTDLLMGYEKRYDETTEERCRIGEADHDPK